MISIRRLFRLDILAIAVVVCVVVGALAFLNASGRVPLFGTLLGTSCRENDSIVVSPYIADKEYRGPGEILILNAQGKIEYKIALQYPALSVKLEKGGTFLAALTPPGDPSANPSGGKTGILQRVDMRGRVLWEYRDERMHHGFDILPDGSIAYIAWVQSTADFARRIKGGSPEEKLPYTWGDEIILIDPSGNKIWSWRFDENLDPAAYTLNPYTPRSVWTHANSVKFIAENPITNTPAFLVSARHLNTVFIIEKDSGQVLWQSPKDMLSFQHDATWTSKGTILVFDNGFFRKQTRPFLWSRVVEIDPLTNKIVWEYNGGKGGAARSMFSSSIMGAAARRPNGNTVITLSTQGVIVEVDREGRIVREQFNRYRNADGEMRIVFKAEPFEKCAP